MITGKKNSTHHSLSKLYSVPLNGAKGDNSVKKRIRVGFLKMNPIMKFQNLGFKLFLNGRTGKST